MLGDFYFLKLTPYPSGVVTNILKFSYSPLPQIATHEHECYDPDPPRLFFSEEDVEIRTRFIYVGSNGHRRQIK